MKFDQGIQTLENAGLNIFVSAKVRDLPAGIYPWSEDQMGKTLCLIGNGGKSLWNHLSHPLNPVEHPIDNFSLNFMKWFAENILQDEIEILFPHDDTQVLPLQQLGRFFNLCTPSPIGIDISDKFGLWFAYRGVFLTQKNIPLKIMNPISAPICDTCKERCCLVDGRTACPAKKEHQYSVEQNTYHAYCASQLPLIHC